MTALYLDTSAFMRALLTTSSDHEAMRRLIDDPALTLISSELLELEAARTAIRLANEDPSLVGLQSDVAIVLRHMATTPLSSTILAAAKAIPEIVKSLDAIHIATIETLRGAIDAVITYDRTMTTVLRAHGITVTTAAQYPSY